LYNKVDNTQLRKKIKKMAGACSTDGGGRGMCMVLVRNPEGKRPLGRPRVDGRIILRCIFKKWDVEVWAGLGWFRIQISGGHL
jgi:hypothetical protein